MRKILTPLLLLFLIASCASTPTLHQSLTVDEPQAKASTPHHESMRSLKPDSATNETQSFTSSEPLSTSAPSNSHAHGGLPKTTRKIRILEYKNYTVGFSDYYKLPLYTQRNFSGYPKNCTETGRGAAKFSVDTNLPAKLQLTHDDFNDPQCASSNKKVKSQKCLRRGLHASKTRTCFDRDALPLCLGEIDEFRLAWAESYLFSFDRRDT